MDEKQFAMRLSQLRAIKGVSARDMSLSLGQTHSYINMIENGKMMPSLAAFFYICEYLDVTPGEFFDDAVENPIQLREITEDLKRLNHHQLQLTASMIKELARK